MNMKKKIKNISARNLWQGVAGICFSVTVFVLPFNAQAEGAMNAAEVKPAAVEQNASETPKPKYVMPQEQVYLDPSQEEAAKKQQEADAIYNSVPQNRVPAVDKEKNETAEIKANEKFQTGINKIADWLLNIRGSRVAPDNAFLVKIN